MYSVTQVVSLRQQCNIASWHIQALADAVLWTSPPSCSALDQPPLQVLATLSWPWSSPAVLLRRQQRLLHQHRDDRADPRQVDATRANFECGAHCTAQRIIFHPAVAAPPPHPTPLAFPCALHSPTHPPTHPHPPTNTASLLPAAVLDFIVRNPNPKDFVNRTLPADFPIKVDEDAETVTGGVGIRAGWG